MALAGLEYDELSKNFLSLSDLDKSFKNSEFNKNDKKIDMIILNNCLMGSIETADILSNYANYLVASEDVMLGSKYISTFKFLEGIDAKNNAVDIGKNYIDCYTNSIEENFPGEYITFSLIDLSKIDNIIENLDDYFKNINLDSATFKKIDRIRDGVYEYQKQDDYLDMVDLYQLITKLKSINSNNEKLLNSIDKAVLYNSTTDPYSKGISMYFPETSDWTKVYDTLEFSENYKKFVDKYIDIYTGKTNIKFSLNNKEIQKKDNGFSLQLTEEEASIYKNGQFVVFEDNKDGTYTTVIRSSSDVSIDDNGVITGNIGEMISLTDSSDGTEFAVGNLILIDKTDSYSIYGLPIILYNNSDEDPALMKLKVRNDGKIDILETRQWSKDENGNLLANGAIIDLKDTKYKRIKIVKNVRTIKKDENGNYAGLDELKSTYGYEWDITDFLNSVSFKNRRARRK